MAYELDIIPGTEWGFFTLPRPMCIAGPCSAESEEQVMETARGLAAFGIHVFRAGIWKPRTHPGCFEGIGTPGFPWLRRVQKELDMKVCTEVASAKHVSESLAAGVDMVWLGARTTANPFLVQEIADALSGSDIPVLVKNPVNADLELWIGALERLNRAGVKKLGVIHRGFTPAAPMKYRNDPGWNLAVELRIRYPKLVFFADPSHMGGDRKYLQELSQRAMDLGLEGLMLESHCNPSVALSDAKQQLTPAEIQNLLESLVIRDNSSDSTAFREGLHQLRAQIDVLDDNLLWLLKSRMDVSRKIGQNKKEHNVAILQMGRWDELMSAMVEKGRSYGLSEGTIRTIMNAIHDESVRVQNEVLAEGRKQ